MHLEVDAAARSLVRGPRPPAGNNGGEGREAGGRTRDAALGKLALLRVTSPRRAATRPRNTVNLQASRGVVEAAGAKRRPAGRTRARQAKSGP